MSERAEPFALGPTTGTGNEKRGEKKPNRQVVKGVSD